MTRASLLSSAAMFATLAIVPNSGTAQWQSHDRNNEPACSQIGNVDPRCFVAQLDESQPLNDATDDTQNSGDADESDDD